MKKTTILAIASVALLMGSYSTARAQEVVVDEVSETVVVADNVVCSDHYYSPKGANWFLQLGAGIAVPLVEDYARPAGEHSKQITANYNLAVGRWFSPYLGARLSFQGGALHWNNEGFSRSKYVTGNLDLMWDMFNSYRVNDKRVFSLIPFVGIGGTYVWDFKAPGSNIVREDGKTRYSQWCLPVSAGLQLRFRLSKYADFFIEGRAQFYGDNFNNCAYDKPIDVNITAIGGFTFTFGGRNYTKYNPCDYLGYIAQLNNQVNDLRGALATCNAALAAANAQLPCPEVVEAQETTIVEAPLMATVRFKINSAVISREEEVNVYNTAQWMKANPGQNVVICGYADRDTGTSAYNMSLSKRRAEAVKKQLVERYGIAADRLSTESFGSDKQPYETNNWNRIVIFEAN